MADRVIQRNDTAANWQSVNPVLATGEIGIEIDGAKGYKIGDGKTRWNDLPYPANPTNVVQDIGNNENVVMSQKAVTKKFSELASEVCWIDASSFKKGYLSDDNGITVIEGIGNTIYNSIYYKVIGGQKYSVFGLDELRLTVYFYDDEKKYIGTNGWFSSDTNIYCPKNTHYIRISLRNPNGDLTALEFDSDISFVIEYYSEVTVLNSFEPKKLSIIGDSISTYDKTGYKIDGYSMYFPHGDIDNINKTYWKQLLNIADGEIEVNASYSGSCASNKRESGGYPSLCDRVSLLGNPDTIIIALGTNDSNYNVPLGEFEFEKTTNELSEDTFRGAYIKGVKLIQELYPNSSLILAAFRMADGYYESIKVIAKYYGIRFVGINNYESEDGKHPTLRGMREIAYSVSNVILSSEFNNDFSGFDATYSTTVDANNINIDNIKTAGIYKRHDKGASRGQMLFVSQSLDKSIIYQREVYVNNYGVLVDRRRSFNGEWSEWNNATSLSTMNLPTISINGKVEIGKDSIAFKGSPYLYTKTSRLELPKSADLELTTAITKVVYDREADLIFDASANTWYDETNKITLGFIVRDDNGEIKNLLANIACQEIVYQGKKDVVSYTGIYNPTQIKYIPHRGIKNAEIPENTTYSVMYAALYGLKYAECDVRYTSDGIGVVMHDTTINRTMYNSDLSAISADVTIAESTYETLSQYVYKSTNEVYRTRLQTMKQYIDACAQWDICPIIQGSMSDDDLSYCMQRLGDNWICYGGNFAKVRAYSQNVLCLTSASYNSVDAMVTALRGIGGNVGLSRLYNSELTDEYIAACKANRWEVMASYAYEKASIPDAIRRGATIVLSDNVGKDTNKVLVSSLKSWESFTHNGTISANTLVLNTSQWLNKYIEGKGSYKIYIQFTGEGAITLPNYDNAGNYGSLTFPMNNGVFIYTFTHLEEEGFTLSIDSTSTISIERFIICREEVIL